MFITKNLCYDIKNVPVAWIFQHFCNLNEPLIGQDVKIKSLFNLSERTPSMCIYLNNNNIYKYKDFSTGKTGSALDLVMEISNLSFPNASKLVIETYNNYIINNEEFSVGEFKKVSKYKVNKYTFRNWTTHDQLFWTQFNIGSSLLNNHNVRPLESYELTKDESSELCIKGLYLYGYFKNDGTLYKIYQPKNVDKKFIKVNSYIQGYEQLSNYDNLIITSSLKDIMAIKSLKLKIDIIAPDSENTMINSEIISELLEKYKNVIVMFDNDDAGIVSMKKYKELYPCIKTGLLPMSKDPSDSIKDFGAREVRNRIVPILDKKIQDD